MNVSQRGKYNERSLPICFCVHSSRSTLRTKVVCTPIERCVAEQSKHKKTPVWAISIKRRQAKETKGSGPNAESEYRTKGYTGPSRSRSWTVETNLIGGIRFQFSKLEIFVSRRDANLSFPRSCVSPIVTEVSGVAVLINSRCHLWWVVLKSVS